MDFDYITTFDWKILAVNVFYAAILSRSVNEKWKVNELDVFYLLFYVQSHEIPNKTRLLELLANRVTLVGHLEGLSMPRNDVNRLTEHQNINNNKSFRIPIKLFKNLSVLRVDSFIVSQLSWVLCRTTNIFEDTQERQQSQNTAQPRH